jgi:hypothetical protein
MSLLFDSDDEDFYNEEYDIDDEYDDDDDNYEYDEKADNLLLLNNWIYFNDIDNKHNQFSCNLVLPNPRVLGIEKSYEICEFLVKEIYGLLMYESNTKSNKHLMKAFTNCIFIIEDMIINQLKM